MPRDPVVNTPARTNQERLGLIWRSIWPIGRQILGWLCIVLGVLGLFLPFLQGILFLVIGIALVGRRNWLLRWIVVHLKLLLRAWASHPTPSFAFLGRLALRGQQRLSVQRRRLAFHWKARQERRKQLKSNQ